jgi:hypothetical protein
MGHFSAIQTKDLSEIQIKIREIQTKTVKYKKWISRIFLWISLINCFFVWISHRFLFGFPGFNENIYFYFLFGFPGILFGFQFSLQTNFV